MSPLKLFSKQPPSQQEGSASVAASMALSINDGSLVSAAASAGSSPAAGTGGAAGSNNDLNWGDFMSRWGSALSAIAAVGGGSTAADAHPSFHL